MKVNFINSTLNFKRGGIYKEIEVSTIGKEQGWYNNNGAVDTTYMPENYMHQDFTFEAVTNNAYAILNNTNASVNYGIIVIFQDDTVLKVYTADEVGKILENFKVKLPIGANRIGMSVNHSANCNAQVFIPDLTE